MNPVKILHIDADYQIVYFILLEGTLIKTPIPMGRAIKMLKNESFDLILSEPQHLAILTPKPRTDQRKI